MRTPEERLIELQDAMLVYFGGQRDGLELDRDDAIDVFKRTIAEALERHPTAATVYVPPSPGPIVLRTGRRP